MILKTLHGDLKTPAFLPDATYGAVKTLSFNDVKATGTNALVSTTLHLEQRIGSKYIKDFGGIHKFFGWDKPILTDSGGYQVFSLIYRSNNPDNKISDAGCSFVDYKTGKHYFLSPEISQIIQFNLNPDIVTVLDVPIRNEATTHELKESIKRNTEWAKRSKAKFLELHNLTENDFNDPDIKRPLIGAVIQGGNHKELRRQSAEELIDIGFDLYNYGGAPIHNEKNWHNDAPKGFNREMIEYVGKIIPKNKIKYAMGIGTPDDMVFSIEAGWDIFDTVLPTRNARHGFLYVSPDQGDNDNNQYSITNNQKRKSLTTNNQQLTTYSVLHVKNSAYAFSDEPVDANCNCECCTSVSRAYLRHLIKLQEPAGQRLASIHNLHFFQKIISNFNASLL